MPRIIIKGIFVLAGLKCLRNAIKMLFKICNSDDNGVCTFNCSDVPFQSPPTKSKPDNDDAITQSENERETERGRERERERESR